MKIEYTCKICKQPREMEMPTNPPPLAEMEKLLPLVVCNPCYDLREKFKGAEAKIYRACASLDRLEMLKANDAGSVRDRCRAALEIATKHYAQALAVYFKLENYVWDMDFVTQLMQRPADAWAILRQYRAALKAIVKA